MRVAPHNCFITMLHCNLSLLSSLCTVIMADNIRVCVPLCRKFVMTTKVPDTKGCLRCCVGRNPYNGYKYLCGAMPNSVFLMQWYDPLNKFMLLKVRLKRCRVDVSYKLPPYSLVLRLLPRQSLLPQAHIYASSPSVSVFLSFSTPPSSSLFSPHILHPFSVMRRDEE